jgi:hypothetical protein
VIAVLRKPRTLVLLVQDTRRHRQVITGLVPLDHYPIGTFRIRWNLRVDGKRLSKGTYEVACTRFRSTPLPPTSRSRKARFRDPRWRSAHAERGRAADRARYQLPYIHVLRYRDGLHVSFNLVFDRLLMLEQLGLVPAPAALQ